MRKWQLSWITLESVAFLFSKCLCITAICIMQKIPNGFVVSRRYLFLMERDNCNLHACHSSDMNFFLVDSHKGFLISNFMCNFSSICTIMECISNLYDALIPALPKLWSAGNYCFFVEFRE